VDFARESRSVSLALISGRGHYETVISAIGRAESSVWISTSNLKELLIEDQRRISRRRGDRRGRSYRSVLALFDELARSSVEIRVLHAKYPSRAFREEFDRHPRLVEGGLELRLCPRVHMKAVIVDGRFLYLGSANWTGAGLGAKGEHRRNFELGIVTEDESMLDEVQAMFDHLWRGGECAKCRLRRECESPLDLEARKERSALALKRLPLADVG
jgi:phosphatidylserine/phosphatidylglycerophosphate/cardiolipin synthase-like enzyme